MAITYSSLQPPTPIGGGKRVVRGLLAFDSSYPTGGELIDSAKFGLKFVESFEIKGSELGYDFEYVPSTKKLKVYSGGLSSHDHAVGTLANSGESAGTPAGSVAAPTFTGSPDTITPSLSADSAGTPAGNLDSISGGTPAGTLDSVSGGTPAGTNSAPAFTGTPDTITPSLSTDSAGTPAGTLDSISGGTPAGTLDSVSGGTPAGTLDSISGGTPAGTNADSDVMPINIAYDMNGYIIPSFALTHNADPEGVGMLATKLYAIHVNGSNLAQLNSVLNGVASTSFTSAADGGIYRADQRATGWVKYNAVPDGVQIFVDEADGDKLKGDFSAALNPGDKMVSLKLDTGSLTLLIKDAPTAGMKALFVDDDGADNAKLVFVDTGAAGGTINAGNFEAVCLSAMKGTKAGNAKAQTFSGAALGGHVHTFSGAALGGHAHAFSGAALGGHAHTFSGAALGTHGHIVTGAAYTPAGSVAAPAFSGAALAGHGHTFSGAALGGHAHTFSGSALGTHVHTVTGAAYTPAGSNSAPAFSGSALGNHGHTIGGAVAVVAATVASEVPNTTNLQAAGLTACEFEVIGS